MPSALLAILIALAAINLAAGLWLLFEPGRTSDLERVTEWARLWGSGVNPYASTEASVDYPPWGLVTLYPLTLIPDVFRTTAWVLVNLVLLAALATRLVREAREPARIGLALVAILLAAAAARTWTQFSLFSYFLGVAGALSPSPLGALAVGLALLKPQVGGVVLLWMIFRRQWSRVCIALLVPVLLTGLFAARLHVDPVSLMDQYAQALAFVHAAAEPLEGHTELRAWLAGLWPAYAGRLSIAAVLAVVLLLPAAGFAARARRWTTNQSLVLLALCGASSLLAFRHLSYDFILLWPAIVAWRVRPLSSDPGSAGHRLLFAALAGLLIVEVPAWTRLALAYGAPAGLAVLTHLDRVLALGAWVGLSWSLWGVGRLR